MKMAATTWPGSMPWKFGGGGTVWDAISYDPELNLLYIGVGNASPWNRYQRNPQGGDNLFLTSIVALTPIPAATSGTTRPRRARAGTSTAAQQMILADLTIDGTPRKVLMQAPKNGFFYVLDRKTGELISAEPFSKVTWATDVDMKTGRPVEDPDSRDYAKEPKLVWPGADGRAQLAVDGVPPAHRARLHSRSRKRRSLYIAEPERQVRSALWNLGARPFRRRRRTRRAPRECVALFKGSLLAWDPVRQQAGWKVPYKSPGNGGVLATGGQPCVPGHRGRPPRRLLGGQGREAVGGECADRPRRRADLRTWSTASNTSRSWRAGAAASRGTFGRVAAQNRVTTMSRMLVYKIGGKESLPPLPAARPVPAPPALEATKEQVDQGRALYTQYCSLCHGGGAISGGSVPDLRHMDAETREYFVGIVLGGMREEKGMPIFVDRLSIEQTNAIYAYLVKRANDEIAATGAAK